MRFRVRTSRNDAVFWNSKSNAELIRTQPFLSSEQIVILLTQHLASKNSSRLPVLIVAAAYQTVTDIIGVKYFAFTCS